MNRLETEFQRLFALPADAGHDTSAPVGAAASLVDSRGRTRALVIEVVAPVDWQRLGAAWRALQDQLGLPSPALAVSGHDAMQMWLSLAQPVEAGPARQFLEAVRQRWLFDLPRARVRLWPEPPPGPAAGATHVPTVPRRLAEDRWSAFVAPDLAPLFAETPWLDLPPGDDGQASLLAALQPITPSAWDEALRAVAPAASDAGAAAATAAPAAVAAGPGAAADRQAFHDPRDFLRAVMNDPAVPMPLRIDAAKALLAAGGGPGGAG